MFGLLDADGWGWAGVQAIFWFLMVIFLLGYIPNLGYYFTVSDTVDVGYNAVPVVNFCDQGNGDVPCPAPPGTVVPWQPNPKQLALPGGGRSDAVVAQSGAHLYLVGGIVGKTATADVLTTDVTSDGNLTPWKPGPALPEPRADAALATVGGVPYVIGGLDASGNPTDSVFQGTLKEGAVTGWVKLDGSAPGVLNLKLPQPVFGAAAVSTGTGIFVFGGRTTTGIGSATLHSTLGTSVPATLGPWAVVGQIPVPDGGRSDATAVAVGDYVYLLGGEGPNGVSDRVFRLHLTKGELRIDRTTGQPQGWATPPAGQPGNLPEPRAGGAGFTANGSLYLVGGVDAKGTPQPSNDWSVPNARTGDLPGWKRTRETDLGHAAPDAGRAGAAIAAVGSYAFLIGGDSPSGPSDGTFRASLSPKPPFFRLGLFGLTIPALSIKGEIGQQLGYINAAGVATANFVILVLIGMAYSHRRGTMRLIERVTRGRVRAPREDEYQV